MWLTWSKSKLLRFPRSAVFPRNDHCGDGAARPSFAPRPSALTGRSRNRRLGRWRSCRSRALSDRRRKRSLVQANGGIVRFANCPLVNSAFFYSLQTASTSVRVRGLALPNCLTFFPFVLQVCVFVRGFERPLASPVPTD